MRKCYSLLLCLVMLFSFKSADASIIVKLTEQQMAQRADQIVHGKVVRRYSQWDTKRKQIFTYTIIAVIDSFKKKAEIKEVTIRQLGGSRGNIGMRVSGSASFKLGEEVVVFLEKNRQAATTHHVMGMSYGKYTVLENPKSQQKYLVRNLKNLSLATWNAKGQFRLQDAKAGKALITPPTLSDFLSRVRTHLALPRTGKVLPTVKPVLPKLKPVTPQLRPQPTPQP